MRYTTTFFIYLYSHILIYYQPQKIQSKKVNDSFDRFFDKQDLNKDR